MKKFYTLCGLVLSAGLVANAQQSTVKDNTQKHSPYAITTAPGVHGTSATRAVYYSEDFDAGWNGWVADVQQGTVGFELTNVGHANNAGSTFSIPALATSTPTQWVLLDSDSDGTSGSEERATLTSPRIDLSAASGNLKVSFDQFFAEWHPDSILLGWSTDSTTWNETMLMDSVGRDGRPNPENVLVNMGTGYQANADSVWIRFRWYGAWAYGWQIDNVAIEDMPDNDLSVIKTYRSDINAAYEYSEIPLMPASQATDMTVGAIIRNIGALDQSNITVTAELNDGSSVVATNTVTLANLNTFEEDTVFVPLSYTPSATGSYTITLSVPADDDTGNDDLSDVLEVTDYHYSHYKEDPTKVGFTDASQITIGSVFTFENNVTMYEMHAKFAGGTAIGEIFVVQIHEILTSIQDVQQVGTDTEFSIDAADTLPTADWVNIPLATAVTFEAGKAYVVELVTYDGSSAPMYLRSNRDGDADASTTCYGPFGTSSAVNRFTGWGFNPAIRLDFDPNLTIDEAAMNAISLGQNMPNPANDVTTINYTLNSAANVTFTVTDITGKMVYSSTEGTMPAGTFVKELNTEDFPAGSYYYTLTAGENQITKKMMVK